MELLARQFAWRIGRKLYMWARKDQPNDMATNGEERLQRLVAEGVAGDFRLVVFDVGARVGDWTRSLLNASSGRPGGVEVHAFEPVPDSRQAICESLSGAVASGTLRVNATALSDAVSVVPMYVPHHLAGTSTLHPESNLEYEKVLDVETSTVDEYFRIHSLDHVDLLNVDTEGNDLKVIRGALGQLQRGNIGVLQFEYNHRWIYSRTYLRDVFALVDNSPYVVAKICSDAIEVYATWHPELERFFETNYALIHKDWVERLKCTTFRIGKANAFERMRAVA